MSPEKLSRWSLYFHHCCLLFLGQYPLLYNRAQHRFRISNPVLGITIALKLITIVVGPVASLRYLQSFESVPISILPVALNFIADEIFWFRELALLALFVTNCAGFCALLNESIALEEELTKRFKDTVPRDSTSRLYQVLVVLKVVVAVNSLVYVSAGTNSEEILQNAYTIMNTTLFMKGFYFADQFIILLQRIANGLDLLADSLWQLKKDLAHVFAVYDELRYCELINQVAISHTKIYRQFHSILHLFAAPMLFWLLLLCNGIILVVPKCHPLSPPVIAKMSPEKLSRWSLYFHHCCLLFLGQYPLLYNRAQHRFRISNPVLGITIALKLITIVVGPVASLRYLQSFESVPISILPVALNFIADEIFWFRELALLALFVTNCAGFCALLNESIALEEELTKRFKDTVPRDSTSRLYQVLVVLKVVVAVNSLVYVSAGTNSEEILQNAYTIMNTTLFMKGFYFADQFIILLQRIANGLDLLADSLWQLKKDLAHVFAVYDELRYCELINQVAISHTKIYRQFHSILHLFAAPMLFWLLLLCNGIILVLFLELTYLYIMMNGQENMFHNKMIGLTMFGLFCGEIWLLVHMSTTLRKKQQQLEQAIQSVAFLKLKDERIKLMVRLLWMQVKHEKLQVWFAGVIRIDHSLILSIFSSALKFLILLIQFQLQGH